jgi:hypothetical protein
VQFLPKAIKQIVYWAVEDVANAKVLNELSNHQSIKCLNQWFLTHFNHSFSAHRFFNSQQLKH